MTKVGDRVRITDECLDLGEVGTVEHVYDGGAADIRMADNESIYWKSWQFEVTPDAQNSPLTAEGDAK